MFFWFVFFFSSRRRHTRFSRDWSSDVCSSDLPVRPRIPPLHPRLRGSRTHGLWPIGRKPYPGREGASGPIAAGLHLSAIDAAREFRGTTGGKNARLLHPILALDATFEVERLADAIDLLRRPVGNLLVAEDAHLIELLLNQHADATDPFEVLRGCAAQTLCRADAQGAPGALCPALVGLGPHRAQCAQIGAWRGTSLG